MTDQHSSQATLPAILETGSPELSSSELLMLVRDLPERLDDRQLALCDHVAASPVAKFQPAAEGHLAKCLLALDAALPRRKAPGETGELWLRTYERMLGHMPAEQLSFISAKCLERLDWFPTVKQMLDIGKEWRGIEQANRLPQIAAAKSDRERFHRMQEIRRHLKDEVVEQDWIDSLEPGQRKVLETECLLMRDDETGAYRQHPVQIERVRKWHEFKAMQEA